MIGKTSFSNSELALFSDYFPPPLHNRLTRQIPQQCVHFNSMRLAVPAKTLRTFLAVSVSFWLAGIACVWGCDNNVYAAAADSQTRTVISGPSCHPPSHNYCAKKKDQARVTANVSQELPSVLSVEPDGLMRDCPLAINASAVTASKAADHSQDEKGTPSSEVPGLQELSRLSDWISPPVQYLKRGPTYLRCCVFLI
jgi:hypothetical protein